jgi:hypothetical protein
MSITLLPYDNAKAVKGATLMTRDFREVTFLEFNPKLRDMVQVRVQIKGLHAPMTYFVSGRRVLEKETKYDLFIVGTPAPVAKITGKRKAK